MDNPPAFPSWELKTVNGKHEVIENPIMGMKLRDYFAGQALCGHLVSEKWCEQIAKKCYAMADAMLAERIKNGK